jgi:hypothetical protein
VSTASSTPNLSGFASKRRVFVTFEAFKAFHGSVSSFHVGQPVRSWGVAGSRAMSALGQKQPSARFRLRQKRSRKRFLGLLA